MPAARCSPERLVSIWLLTSKTKTSVSLTPPNSPLPSTLTFSKTSYPFSSSHACAKSSVWHSLCFGCITPPGCLRKRCNFYSRKNLESEIGKDENAVPLHSAGVFVGERYWRGSFCPGHRSMIC